MRERVPELESFAAGVARGGLRRTSSSPGWAARASRPRCFRRTFDADELPRARHDASRRDPRARGGLDLERTLFLVASKSGDDARDALPPRVLLGADGRARRALRRRSPTPGSELEATARERGFRAVWEGEPTIGGRYSALSVFGLVPAALMGVDLERLLDRAHEMVEACRLPGGQSRASSSASALGNGLARGARQGAPQPEPGRLRALGRAAARRVDGQGGQGPRPGARRERRRPRPPVRGGARRRTRTSSGQEFYRWEFATAVAGALDRDQPVRPAERPGGEGPRRGESSPRARSRASSRSRSLDELLAQAREGDYFCVQAFVEPTDEAERRIEARARARPRARRDRDDGGLRAALPPLDRPAPQGRARRAGSSSRSSTTPRSSRSPDATSASRGSSRRRRPATSRRCASAAAGSRASDWRSIA